MKKNLTIIFFANFFTLLSGVVTSLLTAWALGPERRGDLALVVLYPNVVALAVGFGLPQAHRYFLARDPEEISPLFSNALIFAVVTGALALAAAELIVPSLIGARSEAVIWLVKIYLINIPLALLYDLMAGMLEGSRQFKWAALARVVFFGIQSAAYFLLWNFGLLTVYTAALTMIVAQTANTLTATFSVYRVLKPRWKPCWTIWRKSIAFGLKYHVGVVTSFTTLRLDQLMLGAMATSVEIGLYIIAVRLSEITTVLASSIAEVLMPEVAASKHAERSAQLLMRSLRLMIYVYLLILIPLLLLAPTILNFAFGAEFLAAAGTLRLLLIASMVWSVGAIIVSGLNGFGYPGLSTVARLSSAVVTVFALLYWLPRYGIVGAALSSLIGYSVMLAVALFWLTRKNNLRLSEIFRPRLSDINMKKFMTVLKSSFNLETEANIIDAPKSGGFHQLFERQATAQPDRLAIVCKGERLTYGELNKRANQLARHLRSRGAMPETLIPICVDRSVEMAIGILGILKSGAAYVPIDPAYPAERIEFMLAEIAAPFIVTQSSFLQTATIDKILLDADWKLIAENSIDDLLPTAAAENLAYVIYTSGSTGKPKGAMLTHANLCHYAKALQREFHLTPDDKYLHLASIAFSSSRRHLLFPLAHGASVVIADEEQRMDALPLFKLIKEQAATVFDAVPSFQRYCMNALLELHAEQRNELLDNDLRLIVSASEPLLSDIPATWMFEFGHPARHVHMIGQTETSGIVAINHITEQAAGAVRPVPVGRAIADTKIYLLDENRQPVAPGEAGEMYVCGNGLGRGYLNRPELTREKFINWTPPGKFAVSLRLYKTGDLARRRRDGMIEILGRADYQVKLRGFRIELGEIEAVLSAHPNVSECVVALREDVPGNKQLIAYLTTKDHDLDSADLRRHAKSLLPEYMTPAAFVLLKEWKLTPNGKIDRRCLPAPEDAPLCAETEYAAPRSPLEEKMLEIWSRLLRRERIGINDNFFDLGGHSLLATQVASRFRDAFGKDIPLRMLFETPTIAGLAEQISTMIYSEQSDQLNGFKIYYKEFSSFDESPKNDDSPLDDAELERLLTELENVSDEEAERLIAAESDFSLVSSAD